MDNNLVAKDIEEYIGQLSWPKEPKNLYDPIRYIMSLGGKRARSVVALNVGECLGIEPDDAKKLALAIELFHNFTLVHDDIMDKADTRRGNSTVHKKWNENVAILSGDAMLIEVYKLLTDLQNPNALKLIKRFSDVALEVCEGQQYDMDFETRENVTQDEYLEMIRLKTAVLLGLAFEAPAILLGDEAVAQRLYTIGENMGLSFQIKDDLLDAFPENQAFGKQIGGDILSAKKTILYLKTLHLASAEEKENLRAIYAKSTRSQKDVDAVKAIMLNHQIPENANQLAASYQNHVLSNNQQIQSKSLQQFIENFSAALLSRTV